jgi:hypothetical protein
VLKELLKDLTSEELKKHLDSKDGNCDNCDNRSKTLKIELCPVCYKEIIVGPDYTVKEYITVIKEILNERN